MTEAPILNRFDLAMRELISDGLDFKNVAEETLREIVGDSPFLVLLPRIEANPSPRTFLTSLSTVFPSSVVRTIMILISKRALSSLPTPSEPKMYPEYESLLANLQKAEAVEKEGARLRLLHDHREEDELDKLVGHKTD